MTVVKTLVSAALGFPKRLFFFLLALSVTLSAYSKTAPDTLRFVQFQAIEEALNNDDPSVYNLLDDFTMRYGVTSDALTLQALAHYAEGDAVAGKAKLERALDSITKDDLTDRSAILLVLAGKESDDLECLRYINSALQSDPRNSKALGMRARLYLNNFMLKEAETDAKKAFKYSGGNPTYRSLLCQIHILQIKNRQALKEANSLIREFPNYPQPYVMRAYLVKEKGDTARYVDDYLIYLQLTHNLDLSPIFEVAGTHYDYIMEYAGQILKRAMGRENIAYWNYFIVVMKENAGEDVPVENLNTALANAEDPDLLCHLYLTKSDYHLRRAQYDSSLVMMQAVIDTVERNGGIAAYWLYKNKAYFLNKLHRYAEADSAFTQALARTIQDSAEHSTTFYLRYDLRYDNLRDTLGALADLDSALAYTPDATHLLYARGRLYEILGRKDDANTDYEHILLLDTAVTSDSYRPFALAKLGRRAEAEQWLKQMMDDTKNEGSRKYLLYNAACMYSILNDVNTAVKYLMDAMAISPIDCDQIRNDEDFANIRNTPEFKSILRVSCSDL